MDMCTISPTYLGEQVNYCQDFDLNENRHLIIESFQSLGMNKIAERLRKKITTSSEVCKYARILEGIAVKLKRPDVVEQLCFASLIYG